MFKLRLDNEIEMLKLEELVEAGIKPLILMLVLFQVTKLYIASKFSNYYRNNNIGMA